VAPLANVRRERAALEHGAHLLGDHRDRVRHHREIERIERRRLFGLPSSVFRLLHARSTIHPPIGSERAFHEGATTIVASASVSTCGPASVRCPTSPAVNVTSTASPVAATRTATISTGRSS